jgi:hypothetical protein
MKIIFITATLSIIWYMRKHKTVSQTYSKEEDTFRLEYLIVPSFLLALLVNHELSVMEVRANEPRGICWLTARWEGAVDLFHLSGGGGHPAAAGAQSCALCSLMCLRSCGGAQVMLQNSGNVDNLTGHYVFFLGCVSAFSALRHSDSLCAPVPIARSTCSTGYTGISMSPATGIGSVRLERYRCEDTTPHSVGCSLDLWHGADHLLLRLFLLLPQVVEEQ